jgi:hypothetical protein
MFWIISTYEHGIRDDIAARHYTIAIDQWGLSFPGEPDANILMVILIAAAIAIVNY